MDKVFVQSQISFYGHPAETDICGSKGTNGEATHMHFDRWFTFRVTGRDLERDQGS